MPPNTLTLRLDPRALRRLEEAASRQGIPLDLLARRAVARYLDAQDALRSEIDAAVAEAEAGSFVSAAAMRAWMKTWDTDHERPPPEPDIHPPGR